MGLKVGEVKLEPWTPEWGISFESEKARLLHFFSDLNPDIQHVGSTSIKGLDAKPIIDILVGLPSLSDFENVRATFESLPDYSIKSDSDPDEILIRKGSEENRTHFIHVVSQASPRYDNMLKFRDILRSNPAVRQDYSELKHQLAEQYPHDREHYTSSKSSFITRIISP